MKYEVMVDWVAALRSGEYKQGNGRLRDGDRFCCLGVLCDISKQGKWQEDNSPYGNFGSVYLGSECLVPLAVRKYSGLQSANPHVGTGQPLEVLSILNDSGSNFNKIADLIEKHWESL